MKTNFVHEILRSHIASGNLETTQALRSLSLSDHIRFRMEEFELAYHRGMQDKQKLDGNLHIPTIKTQCFMIAGAHASTILSNYYNLKDDNDVEAYKEKLASLTLEIAKGLYDNLMSWVTLHDNLKRWEEPNNQSHE